MNTDALVAKLSTVVGLGVLFCFVHCYKNVDLLPNCVASSNNPEKHMESARQTSSVYHKLDIS